MSPQTKGEKLKNNVKVNLSLLGKSQKLNNLNQKTATGMEYNSVRAAAMYRKLKKIMK